MIMDFKVWVKANLLYYLVIQIQIHFLYFPNANLAWCAFTCLNAEWFQSVLTLHHCQCSYCLVPLTCLPLRRCNICPVDVFGLPGMELERLVHPSALGLPLPDSRKYLLLVADRLSVWPHLHPGHHHLPATPAVYSWRGHSGEWNIGSPYFNWALSHGGNLKSQNDSGHWLLYTVYCIKDYNLFVYENSSL